MSRHLHGVRGVALLLCRLVCCNSVSGHWKKFSQPVSGPLSAGRILMLSFLSVLLTGFCTFAIAEFVPVSAGPTNDYQADVIRPWGSPDRRMVVFERLASGTLSGDLLITQSTNGGQSWSEPQVVIATAANERHPALIQTGAASYQLFYLSNATGSFRIHRASSTDGQTFAPHGALDLGWPTGGEINPHVIRHANGDLTMTYHRLSGAAFIARSFDDGASWDTTRVQISPASAALPRIAYRESDGLYLLVYQTNPGNNQLQLWSRTSTDPGAWTDTPQLIVTDGNNHDALPLVLENDRLAVFWSRVAEGNFQVVSAESAGGNEWTPPAPRITRPGLANVQPHGLLLPGHGIDLYWGAEQTGGSNVFDIVRTTVDLEGLFSDRFETDPDASE